MGKSKQTENIEAVDYQHVIVSGNVVVEVSGVVKLENVVLGIGTSGQLFTILDSCISGLYKSAGVTVVGVGRCGSALENPSTMKFSTEIKSGLVIISSGVTTVLTATYK